MKVKGLNINKLKRDWEMMAGQREVRFPDVAHHVWATFLG